MLRLACVRVVLTRQVQSPQGMLPGMAGWTPRTGLQLSLSTGSVLVLGHWAGPCPTQLHVLILCKKGKWGEDPNFSPLTFPQQPLFLLMRKSQFCLASLFPVHGHDL